MNKRYRWLLSALLVLPMFAACEQVDRLSSVDAPRYSESTTSRQARPVQKLSNDTTTTVALQVTPSVGGTMTIGQYKLVIPAGAVAQPTTFYMTKLQGNLIKVRLRAFDKDGEVTQFMTGLTLTLPYGDASAEDKADPYALRIANVSEDGLDTILEIVAVTVDTVAETITGQITHFSDYAASKEYSIGID